MTLQVTGSLSALDLQIELQITEISCNSDPVRELANKLTGDISYSDFYGKMGQNSTSYSLLPGFPGSVGLWTARVIYSAGYVYWYGMTTMYGTQAYNGFILKYTLNGILVWGRALSSTTAGQSLCVTHVTDVGNLLILNIDLDPVTNITHAACKQFTFSMTSSGSLSAVDPVSAHVYAYRRSDLTYRLVSNVGSGPYSNNYTPYYVCRVTTFAESSIGPRAPSGTTVAHYNSKSITGLDVPMYGAVLNDQYISSSGAKFIQSSLIITLNVNWYGILTVYDASTDAVLGLSLFLGTSVVDTNKLIIQSVAISAGGNFACLVEDTRLYDSKLWVVIFNSAGTIKARHLLRSSYTIAGRPAVFFDENSNFIYVICNLDLSLGILQYSYDGIFLGAYDASSLGPLFPSIFFYGVAGAGYLFTSYSNTWYKFPFSAFSKLPRIESYTPTVSSLPSVQGIAPYSYSTGSNWLEDLNVTTSII